MLGAKTLCYPRPAWAVLLAYLALLSACSSGGGGGSVAAFEGTFAFSGGVISASGEMTVRVFDNISRKPLAGVVVKAGVLSEALTGSDGRVQFSGLPANLATSVTAGLVGHDLISVVGVNASKVSLALNPVAPELVFGSGSVSGLFTGLNPGDQIQVESNFAVEGSFTFNSTTNVYSIQVLADRRFSLSFLRTPAGAQDADVVIRSAQGPLGPGSVLNLDFDFPTLLAVQAAFVSTFLIDGAVAIPSILAGGELVVAARSRSGEGRFARGVVTGTRAVFDGLFSTGEQRISSAGGTTAFNLTRTDPGLSNLLFVSATSSGGGVTTTAERFEPLGATLPTTLSLRTPFTVLAPAANATASGLTPQFQVNFNLFLDGTNGFWDIQLRDTVNSQRWQILVNGSLSSFALPSVSTDATLSSLGLTVGNPVVSTVTAQTFDGAPSFDFNAVDLDGVVGLLDVRHRARVESTFTP